MEDKIELAVLVTEVDKDGNVISTNKNGVVLTKDFSSLMSTYADNAGVAKKALIATFISDENGEFTSNAVIRADKIDFVGKTMINGKFIVDKDGHVTMNDFTANNGVFNGEVNASSGMFNGEVNANSGSFENVTVRNINSSGDPFYIDRYGNFYGKNIDVHGAYISGDIRAANATFTNGIFQRGTFENITLKKSINTAADNLYIDATGAVTVKGKINATSGSFENVTVKNINTVADPFHIDASGVFHGKNVVMTGGTFSGKITSADGDLAGWKINADSISKNDVVLGADGSIYNSDGAWKLGNDRSGYLADGNISWDGAGNSLFNGKIVTGSSGHRIEIDPASQEFRMYESSEEIGCSIGVDEDGINCLTIKGRKYGSRERTRANITGETIGVVSSDSFSALYPHGLRFSSKGVFLNIFITNSRNSSDTPDKYIFEMSSNSWPTSPLQVLDGGVYLDGNTLKVKL